MKNRRCYEMTILAMYYLIPLVVISFISFSSGVMILLKNSESFSGQLVGCLAIVIGIGLGVCIAKLIGG